MHRGCHIGSLVVLAALWLVRPEPLDGFMTGLDIGLWQPLARGASESENPLAPQKIHWPPPKTCNDQNVFSAGIYDFTREVANFCTLGLYITKNKYELTLPSEFCRFPVKIMAAYEALKKKKKKTLAPRASGK